MIVMGRKLVSNDQGGPLAALQVSVNQTMTQHSLQAVAVHAVAILICESSLDLLSPLVTMLNDPGSMEVSKKIIQATNDNNFFSNAICLQCLKICFQKLVN